MKNRSLIFLLCLSATGICIAQTTINSSADTSKDSTVQTEVIIGKPYDDATIIAQRHASTDLINAILNINADKLPVLIQYQDNNKETAIFVKEIQETLVQYGLKVSTSSSQEPMHMANNPKHNNCTYEIKDGLFVVTAYPAKTRQ